MSFEVKNLSYSFKNFSLNDISFAVPDSSFTSIIGKTGSGKTTLAKIMCSLIKANGVPNLKQGQISMICQNPESQFFEKNVIKETTFSLLNMGMKKEEAEQKAKKVLSDLGIEENLFERDPFTLSGGQKRKLAIASIIVMNPQVLILDEVGAGLDPVSRKSILNLIKTITKENKTTVFNITHNMDEAVRYSDFILELENGSVKNFGTVREVMEKSQMVPEITKIMRNYYPNETILTLEEAVKTLNSHKEPCL